MQPNIQIFEKMPDDFNAKFGVSAAYIEVDGKILLLQLSNKKEYSKRWGVPAGKVEYGETPEDALHFYRFNSNKKRSGARECP